VIAIVLLVPAVLKLRVQKKPALFVPMPPWMLVPMMLPLVVAPLPLEFTTPCDVDPDPP
jgi:hypothetical protein